MSGVRFNLNGSDSSGFGFSCDESSVMMIADDARPSRDGIRLLYGIPASRRAASIWERARAPTTVASASKVIGELERSPLAAACRTGANISNGSVSSNECIVVRRPPWFKRLLPVFNRFAGAHHSHHKASDRAALRSRLGCALSRQDI